MAGVHKLLAVKIRTKTKKAGVQKRTPVFYFLVLIAFRNGVVNNFIKSFNGSRAIKLLAI